MNYISILKDHLAKLESETEEWDAKFKEAEVEMYAKMAPYHKHHTEIRKLKQAIAILDK